jgi:predicted enzyme related to lactoylglutathione lyase
MRQILLAATAALILLGGETSAATGKKPDVGPGRVAWFDITTTNVQQSSAFYGGLFGWQFTPVTGAGPDLAMEIVADGTPVGTLRKAEGAISLFNGVVYVQVTDLPASCKKALELGGKIPPGFPFNLPDGKGAIALVADPAGHPIGMYSPTPLPEAAPAK